MDAARRRRRRRPGGSARRRPGRRPSEQVKADEGAPRRYRSPRRAAQAAETRRAVLAAARELLSEVGYRGMTVAAIARRADVAVDTVYASVGRKPEVLRRLVETALSGTDETVPAA